MLKVGVIGVGTISKHHIESYMKHEDVEVVAFCDVNEQRLMEKGKLYKVEQLYVEYSELLENKEVDAVSICTWNESHAAIAVAALDAGKHVLVEKPLCMTVEEAQKVLEAVDRNQQVLQVGFVRRHGKNAKLLKQFIDNNELGEIYYAKTSCIRRLGNPGGWFADVNRSGGGPLIDLGVHMIDLCWYMMGKPKVKSVVGNTYNLLGNRSNVENLHYYKASDYHHEINSVEDMANALIRFDNGATLMVDVSYTLHAKGDDLNAKLYGTKGGAELEPSLSMVTEKHNTILNITPQIDDLTFDFTNAFFSQIDHFVRSCNGLEDPLSPVEDGVEIMKILRGIYDSAEKGKEIVFSDPISTAKGNGV